MTRTGHARRAVAVGASAALALIVASATGCHRAPKPSAIATEKALVVKVARAPGLAALEPQAPSIRAVSWGEVFQERARQPAYHWNGFLDGQAVQRVGALEVTRSAGEPARFLFVADVLEGDVPTRAWLCAQLTPASAPARCDERLQRLVVADGVLFAYAPTWRADALVLELVDGAVHTASLPAISEVRVVALAGRPLALVTSHWGRDAGAWTGTDVIALLPRPALQRAGELHLEEIDGRDGARATYWLGALEVRADALHVQGRRSVRDRRTDVELSGEAVDETWALDGDRLVRR